MRFMVFVLDHIRNSANWDFLDKRILKFEFWNLRFSQLLCFDFRHAYMIVCKT